MVVGTDVRRAANRYGKVIRGLICHLGLQPVTIIRQLSLLRYSELSSSISQGLQSLNLMLH